MELGLESRVIGRCECERKMHGQQVGSDRRTGVSREACGTMRVCDMIWNFDASASNLVCNETTISF